MKLHLAGVVDENMYLQVVDAAYRLAPREELHITVNSCGGSFDDGLAIYEILSTIAQRVRVTAYGACHSAAILILAGAETRECTANTKFLLHDETGKIKGNSSQIEKYAKILKSEDNLYNKILASVTGQTSQFWDNLSKKDIMINAKFAQKCKLINDIVKPKGGK